MIHLEVTNGTLVRKGLEHFGDGVIRVGRLTLFRLAQRIFKRLGVYAPKLVGQVYVRTYTARRSRAVTKTKQGYIVTFDPITKKGHPYGVYLRGTPGDASLQARYHQGRWEPYAVILDEEMAKLPAEVREELQKEAARAAQEMKGV